MKIRIRYILAGVALVGIGFGLGRGCGDVTAQVEQTTVEQTTIEQTTEAEQTTPGIVYETTTYQTCVPELAGVVEPEQEELAPATTIEEVDEPQMVHLGEFKITHYCDCAKCNGKWAGGITSTGVMAEVGRTIAVDPKVIPYGSEVVLEYEDGTRGVYIAEDCGGAIKGNRIDVFVGGHQEALDEGVKYAEVYVVKEG